MLKHARFLLTLPVLMLALVAALLASGCMWGVVRDAGSGAGIQGATVSYTDANGNTGSTTSTIGGLYFFNSTSGPIPAVGNVEFQVSAPGFATLTTDRTVLYNDNPNATLADLSTFWEVQSFDLASGSATGAIDTLKSGLGFPVGAVYNTSGDLYVSEHDSCRVRKIDAATGNVTNFAGNGTCGYSGDGGPANSAELSSPSGLALDPDGDVVIVDTGNCRIRSVDVDTHVITTIAGNGTCGFTGDGGDATAAQLGLSNASVPSTFVWSDVTFDSDGNLYIADIFNCRIRKVSGGTISTIAGSGNTGFTCGAFSGDGGTATSARLNQPGSVAVDSDGNVFIGELGGCRIRKVGHGSTHKISTIAGDGTCTPSGDGGDADDAGLGNVRGLALDGAGNLYFSQFGFAISNPVEELNCEVRRIDTSSGEISALAGNGTCGFSGDGGLATDAKINTPGDIALACSGDLAFSEALNNRVRVVTGVGPAIPCPHPAP
jgi:sugar lactone lactonase YvrE